MMTEDQAKGCWCPFSRVYLSGAAVNRDETGGVKTSRVHCIASACMAWRWLMGVSENERLALHGGERRGYCGLAGEATVIFKPEELKAHGHELAPPPPPRDILEGNIKR